MPSSWIERRQGQGPNNRGPRFRVEYRLGGAESRSLYGGSFPTRSEAIARKRWIDGELAAMRVPDMRLLAPEPVSLPTLRDIAAAWKASRRDVSEGTQRTYATNLDRVLPTLGSRRLAEITPAEVNALVDELEARPLGRHSIRKTLSTLAQVLDYAKVTPNPVRDDTVKLPADESEEVTPPTAAHVETVFGVLPRGYRLPILVLDATGMRVGELERLRWGDVDERAGSWRVSRARTKTRKARWVEVPQPLLQAVTGLVPREDRELEAQVFRGFDSDAFRTALARACRATGTPAFSPHDLRHRRASLWHLGGMPVAQACEKLGHGPQDHLKTYAHVVLDREELDYRTLLASARAVPPDMPPSLVEIGR